MALKTDLAGLVLGLVGAYVLRQRLASYVSIMAVPLPSALAYAAEQLVGGLALVVLALALFAVVDVPLQRQLWLRRLRMSREPSRELKEVEGNLGSSKRSGRACREIITPHAGRRAEGGPRRHEPDPLRRGAQVRGRQRWPRRVFGQGADLLALKIRDIAKDAKGAGAAAAGPGPRALRPLQAGPTRRALCPPWPRCWPMSPVARMRMRARMALPVEPHPHVPPKLDPTTTRTGSRTPMT